MKSKLKIAVFSGAIPSTTFIEYLINGVSNKHYVLLFGVISKPTKYKNKNILIYKTPYSHLHNLALTIYRCFLLLVKRPKELFLLIQEILGYSKLYDRWIWFSKFLPIILYRPDIFHIQWARDLEFYWFLKERFNIPIVISLLGSHINYTPIVEPRIADVYRKTFPQVDVFHAVSVAIANEAQLYGAHKESIEIIYSPVKLETFLRYQKLQAKKCSNIKIVSIGRHHWVKGYKYAISAIRRLKDRGVQCKYSIIAEGKVPEDLIFLRDQLSLKDEIYFENGMPQEELFDKMKSFDVLLLPSINEGIANVVLEAMAIGVPVVSTDCGGMSEVVIHKKTGWLVPIRNPTAMADAIVEIVESDKASLDRMTKEAHNLVRKKFDYKQSIDQFIRLYESVSPNSNSKN